VKVESRFSVLLALFHNQKKVHRSSRSPNGKLGINAWDDCYNFAFQAIQELFQLPLVFRHINVESMNPVSQFPAPSISRNLG